MILRLFLILFSSLFVIASLQAKDVSGDGLLKMSVAGVVRILEEQPDSIEQWVDDRVYFRPERIYVTRKDAFICSNNSSVRLPPLAIDQIGPYIICSREKAQEHYDNARDALIEAVGHAMGAGLLMEAPPAALFEGYQAVRSFNECAREYNAAVECDKEGGVSREGRNCD